jgi:hypothetical protein
MTQIPLYYRTDLPDDKHVFKYCNGVPLQYLDHRYFIPGHTDPRAYLGLFGDQFDFVYRDKVKSDNTYYFPFIVSISGLIDVINEVTIPKSVIDDIKNSKCKILVINSFEGWSWKFWKKLVSPIMSLYNIGFDNFVFVCANLSTDTELKTVYDNFWENQTHHDNLQSLLDRGNSSILLKTPRTKKFICLNRRPGVARFAGVTLLYPYINLGYLSLSIKGGIPNPTYVQNQVHLFQENFPKIYKKYLKSNLKDDLPLTIDDNVNAAEENPVNDQSTDKFYNSFLHICAETYHDYRPDRMFFSEKIFKPMLYMQPFVILGPPNSLSTLHSMGYKTFGNVIDERYDGIQDNAKRLHAATNSAIKFFDRPNADLHNDMNKINSVLSHNLLTVSYREHMSGISLKDSLQKYLHE